MIKKEINIVTIGGGSGQFTLLSGLKHLKEISISAVVSMVDSGGSTGRLRDELGILPPGDILKCILALSPYHDTVRVIFQKRFKHDHQLRGHSAGNMLLTMLSRYTGSFPRGIQALAELLDVTGNILPVTTDKATLVAELTDGSRIYGERAIDIPRGTQREKIKDVYMVPHYGDHVAVYPPVLDAIRNADFIILGPGDLFTSIIPNLIVQGVREALQTTNAQLIYILNIMTKFGETHQFVGRDFVQKLEEFIGRSVDTVISNATRPEEKLLVKYAAQKSEFVTVDQNHSFWHQRQLYPADLLWRSGEILRHDPIKLAGLIESVLFA